MAANTQNKLTPNKNLSQNRFKINCDVSHIWFLNYIVKSFLAYFGQFPTCSSDFKYSYLTQMTTKIKNSTSEFKSH